MPTPPTPERLRRSPFRPAPGPLFALLPSLIAGLFAGLFVGLGCAGQVEGEVLADPFRVAIQDGNLDAARALAKDMLAADPGNAKAAARLRDVDVLELLERGRRLDFEHQPQAALDEFLKAQALDPANPTVQVWIAKTRRELAELWLDVANDLSGDADLDHAEIGRAHV